MLRRVRVSFTLSETINKSVYNACVNIMFFYYNDFDGVKGL